MPSLPGFDGSATIDPQVKAEAFFLDSANSAIFLRCTVVFPPDFHQESGNGGFAVAASVGGSTLALVPVSPRAKEAAGAAPAVWKGSCEFTYSAQLPDPDIARANQPPIVDVELTWRLCGDGTLCLSPGGTSLSVLVTRASAGMEKPVSARSWTAGAQAAVGSGFAIVFLFVILVFRKRR